MEKIPEQNKVNNSEKTTEHFNLTNKLHTDVLESKYGKIHSDVLKHDGFMREVFLSDDNNIARTYALTIFEFDKNNLEIKSIDEIIKNCGLIGKTFREHGYEVRKNVTGVFIIENPEWLKSEFADTHQYSKSRLSEFYAKKEDEEPIIYGTLLEVYCPDFRSAEINTVDIQQTNPTTSVLEQAGYSKTEIFDALKEENKFNIDDKRFQKAIEFTKLFPDPTRERFINYISSK